MQSEFNVAGAYRYDRSGPVRWIVSHVLRHKRYAFGAMAGLLVANSLNSLVQRLVGVTFDALLGDDAGRGRLLTLTLVIGAVVLARGVIDLGGSLLAEVTGQRLERDARDELYVSLLGKSQTFHNRQRVGDLMARANNDVRQLNQMIVPGLSLMLDSLAALVVPIVFIAFLDWRLLLSPLLFTVAFAIALRSYTRELNPVAGRERMQFGEMNSVLTEAVTGIEVVKATGQEEQERAKFERTAVDFRDTSVQRGWIEARYIPTLLLAVALGGALLHGVALVSRGELAIGELVSYLGLMQLLRFPTFISLFTFSLVQLGKVSAQRILQLINEETELDQNAAGHEARMEGRIEFRHVGFRYADDGDAVIDDLSFVAEPGQTVAIVGETGSGKSTLTKLVNRIYDATSGEILIDGVDVRAWNLTSLRSQISTIEQEIVLFSRPIAENIAFSLGQRADMAEIQRAAREAQADEFILEMKDGYETIIGERGVTLSGGQRQRVAIARALLTDPRILILDDSTSAVDSATEDLIQQAIGRVTTGRTTLLITHRLSQIRWADNVLVIRRGRFVDFGTHDELLVRSEMYRRIFSHYDEAGSEEPRARGEDGSPTGDDEGSPYGDRRAGTPAATTGNGHRVPAGVGEG